jgi:integrase
MPTRRRGRPGLEVVAIPGRSALYLRGTVAGRRVYQSAGTADPVLAEEARAVLESKLYRNAVHGAPPERHSFAEALTGYLRDRRPGEGTKAKLVKLLRHFGPATRCDEIGQARIDRAAEVILRPGYAPATKLREIVTPVRAVLQWAAVRRWCAVPSFERARAGAVRTEWLTPAEAEQLLAAAAPHLRPLLEFLLATGARLSEALDLDWRDLDLSNARAVLRETKNGRDRIVPLTPRVVAALAALPLRAGPVFRQRRNKPYADHHRLGGGQIKTAWRGALRRAHVTKPISPHGLRHTWASWHYAMHRDLLRLKHDGDWSTVDLVERYAHLVPDGLAPAIHTFMTAAGVVAADKVVKAS